MVCELLSCCYVEISSAECLFFVNNIGVEDPHLHFIVNDGYIAEGTAYRAEITGTAKGYNSEHKSASR
jgi:hypothetical protein